MAQRTILKNKGLYTDPNQLSGNPDGAMVKAENIVIDRDDVVSSRRGFSKYGNTFGALPSARAKQLLTYKNRILIHENNNLLFNDNPHNMSVDGDFQVFDGSFEELEPGLRLRSVESNKNLFFTSNDGIKKISAKTAADFTTSAGFVRDAGALKALDVIGSLNSTTEGFLPPNSEVAYRVVWTYKDRNDNLIVGAPSSRLVMSNYSTSNANIDLEFVIPQNITSDYFYQVYRSAVFTATGSLTLDDIDPGDELQLVIEDYPTATQLTNGVVTVTDLAPEDFRQGGLPLYTNPSSGDGIASANQPPPKAKDMTMYQSTVFYANTETRAQTTIALLGVDDLVSGSSEVTIGGQTYTFIGSKEKSKIDFNLYSGTIPADLDGKYFLINSSSNKRKYYVWYDNTKTQQILNFTNYTSTNIPGDLKEKFFILHTKDADRKYYVWYDSSGTDIDPGTNPNNNLTGLAGIRVDISSAANKNDIAVATEAAIDAQDVDDDYDTSISFDIVTIESESFDDTQYEIYENLQRGFSFTFNTPLNSDPSNDLNLNTDVIGRVGFRVNVSRGISTVIHVADATAAAIIEQDLAADFEVIYTNSDFLEIENTNNGSTDNTSDSLIPANQISNGISITTLFEGTGEDAVNREILLSAAASPAQRIDETARSLVNVINKDQLNTVYAYYISGPTDLPGQILLEVKDIGVNNFSVTASDSDTGGSFNPSLPPYPDAAPVVGEAEIKPNRIYFAKLQQPEAVPLLNFIDVGPEDKSIFRILALRESLFILKEDGVYRLTGLNGNYSVDLFDESTKIIAPDSAVVLNNQIYCLTNLGIVTITDTGVSVISNPIAGDIQLLTSSNYNYKYTSFGVSYENDFAYLLWLPSNVSDTVATQAYRYSSQTQTFTTYKLSKTCGLINPGDDKLYLGTADTNYIERERKLFNRTDFADRDFELIIPSNSVNNTNLKLSSSTMVDIGDAAIQTQYVTVSEYNQLLRKLDLDPSIGESEVTEFDFSGFTGSIPNDLHGKYFLLYSAADTKRYAIFYDSQGNLPLLDTTVYNDIADADQIRVDISSGITTKAQLTEATKTAIQSATFDFIVSYISGQEIFQTTTIRNGNTTDASDSAVNGILNGFSITVLVQGVGDYYNSLQMNQGDSIYSKLNQLAIKLDNDPGIVQSDFVISIGSPTTFSQAQVAFNTIVTKLNNDTGVTYQNYLESSGTKDFEVLIIDKLSNTTDVVTQFSMPFIEGPIQIYKAILCSVQYSPETFGDTSILKQIQEATVIFEDNNFSRATVGFRSDLSPGFEDINFTKSGKGDFGFFTFSQHNWGGGFSGVPLRTYIPRQKQRCRYIQLQFMHDSAREKFTLYGFSYTFRQISERAYRS